MRVKLSLAVLVLVLAIAALCFWTSGGRTAGARPQRVEETDAGPARAAGAELVAVPVPREPELAAREATPEVAVAVAPAAAGTEATEERHRLRGILLHSSDRRPAVGVALVVHFDDEYTEVVTGTDGRFETLVPRGALRAWHRPDPREPLLAQHLDIRPGTFLLPEPGPGGEPVEVELLLVDPAAWLEVEVVTVNGLPAQAMVRWNFDPPEGSGLSMSGSASATDDGGRVRLPFPSVAAGAYIVLGARQEPDLASDVLTVEPPLSGEPVRLVLDTGGTIRAHAAGASGEPRVNIDVCLDALDPVLDTGVGVAKTDAAGIAQLSALAPRRYKVRYWYEESSDWVMAEVGVERGRVFDVELRAPSVPLAVAGRVVDADGKPVEGVQVVARIGDTSTTTVTDVQGAFTVGSSERGSVEVSMSLDLWSDRFEPARLEVPFGTADVLIRRMATRPQTSFSLEVLERGTLARIPDAMVLGFVETDRSNWSFHRARDGLVALELKLYDDTGLSVEAVGYRRRLVNAAELARDVAAGEACRVVLERGLERSLQVFDEESGEPLVGARVLDGDRLVATTDGEGRALIDLPAWPAELRIRAAGHAEGVWSCGDWIAELGDGVVWLERATEEAQGEGR